MLNKQVLSEKTLIRWVLLSAFASMIFILAATLIVYALYDCWALRAIQPGGGDCLPPAWGAHYFLLPVLIGVVFGTVLAIRCRHI